MQGKRDENEPLSRVATHPGSRHRSPSCVRLMTVADHPVPTFGVMDGLRVYVTYDILEKAECPSDLSPGYMVS